MPIIIDKRKTTWQVIIQSECCPYLFYPRSDIACKLLEDKEKDSYCKEENCPLKIKIGLPTLIEDFKRYKRRRILND